MKASPAQPRTVIRDDGTALSYHVRGEGPAVLLANGLGASRAVWRHQLAHLSDRYRLVSWDYRGLFQWGVDSPQCPPTITDHARDALAILDTEGLERVAIVGWSMGVQVALEVFRHAPDRVAALVLLNGSARASWGASPDAGPLRRRIPGVARLARRAPGLLQLLLRGWIRSPEAFTWVRRTGLLGAQLDPGHFADIAADLARLDVRAVLDLMLTMADHDANDLVGSLDVPVLLIASDRDPFTSRAAVERMVTDIPGAEYLLVPGGTHFLPLDRPEHISLRIDKFFGERGFT